MVSRRLFRGKAKPPKKTRSEVFMVNQKHLGNEPTFAEGEEPGFIAKARAFSWYNSMVDDSDVRDYLDVGMRRLGRPDLAGGLRSVPDNLLPKTAAWLCRMGDLGADVSRSHGFIVKSVEDAIKRFSSDDDGPRGPSIQDRLNGLVSETIAEVDGILDEGRVAEFSLYNHLKAANFPPRLASRVGDHYSGLLDELEEAVTGRNPDLKEAYGGFTKEGLVARRDFIRSVVTDAAKYGAAERKVRSARRAKPVSVERKLRDFRYLKEDPQLKVASVNPTDLLGATEVWLYDARYKFMTVLRAPEGRGLDVHRTTIVGYDPTQSMTKNVGRVADKLVESVVGTGKTALRKLMEGIKSKAWPEPKDRVNENTLILRVIR